VRKMVDKKIQERKKNKIEIRQKDKKRI